MRYPRQAAHGRWGGRAPSEQDMLQLMAMRQQHPGMSAGARLTLPVVISLLVQLPSTLYWLWRDPTPAAIAVLLLAIVGPLSLLLIRRYPGPVVAFVSIAASADLFLAVQTQGPPYVALAFAVALSVVHGARAWAWISVGVTWISTVVIGLVLGMDWHPARIAVTTLGLLVVFGIGEGMRTRAERVDAYRTAYAQRRQTEVQAERVRIARELHDVLAHSLSQINVQASVGLHLMDKQPDKAAEALSNIKETSKTALDEVRSVLGVLRAEGGQDPSAPLVPEPDLSRLPGLGASVTSQGVEVAMTIGVTDAPKAVQLAIYRIVQESLTNVVRHAHARHATVTVSQDAGAYVVAVDDDGSGLSEHSESGRGLLGMRERAELLGGTLEIGTTPTGGMLVTAHIPRDSDGDTVTGTQA